MLGRAHLEVGGTGNGRSRVNQVLGVELFGAVVTLVAARVFKAAVRASAFDIAVGQEPPVCFGIDLPLFDFFDQALVIQGCGEMLGQHLVLRAG